MAEAQHTKEQHFIPRTYLQGFSLENDLLYQYNLNLDRPIGKPVPIDSICKKKYLYELKDEHGEFINLNYLENTLCEIEGKFSEFRRQLHNKAIHEENYSTKCFLSKDEQEFWTFFATLNLMRNPVTLDGIKEIIQNEMQGRISDQLARNMAIAYNLPFFRSGDINKLNSFSIFYSVLRQLIITVAYANNDDLFTSDHAMYGSQAKVNGFPVIERLWFPLSSNCGLIFSAPELITGSDGNCLIPLSADQVHNFNKGIAYIATQYVLSKRQFSKSDIALIREARKEKARDESLKHAK